MRENRWLTCKQNNFVVVEMVSRGDIAKNTLVRGVERCIRRFIYVTTGDK